MASSRRAGDWSGGKKKLMPGMKVKKPWDWQIRTKGRRNLANIVTAGMILSKWLVTREQTQLYTSSGGHQVTL